jgi:hypothetical protein
MFAIEESELQRFRELETKNNLLKVQTECLAIENERLKQEYEQLKQQIEKLLDFVADRVEECDVCELTDTCINSEGVCPFAWSGRNIKDLIIKHINRDQQNDRN